MPAPKPLRSPLQPRFLDPSRPWATSVCSLFGIVVGFANHGVIHVRRALPQRDLPVAHRRPAVAIVLCLLCCAWQLSKRGRDVTLDEEGSMDSRPAERPVPRADIALFEKKLASRTGTNLVVTFSDMETAREHPGQLGTPFVWMCHRAFRGHCLVRPTSLRFDGAEKARRANAFSARARAEQGPADRAKAAAATGVLVERPTTDPAALPPEPLPIHP